MRGPAPFLLYLSHLLLRLQGASGSCEAIARCFGGPEWPPSDTLQTEIEEGGSESGGSCRGAVCGTEPPRLPRGGSSLRPSCAPSQQNASPAWQSLASVGDGRVPVGPVPVRGLLGTWSGSCLCEACGHLCALTSQGPLCPGHLATWLLVPAEVPQTRPPRSQVHLPAPGSTLHLQGGAHQSSFLAKRHYLPR